jgi:hypothetical protein
MFSNLGSMTLLIYIIKMSNMNYIEIIKKCYSYSDFCRVLDISLKMRLKIKFIVI